MNKTTKCIEQLIQYFVNNGTLTEAEIESLRLRGFRVPEFTVIESDTITARLKLTKPIALRVGSSVSFDVHGKYGRNRTFTEHGYIKEIDSDGIATAELIPF